MLCDTVPASRRGSWCFPPAARLVPPVHTVSAAVGVSRASGRGSELWNLVQPLETFNVHVTEHLLHRRQPVDTQGGIRGFGRESSPCEHVVHHDRVVITH